MKIEGERQNSAHSMCSNSSFCHIGNNVGIAIQISNAVHGFSFNNLEMGFNSIEINNSSGVIFNGCQMLHGVTGEGMNINVTDGGTIMYNGPQK